MMMLDGIHTSLCHTRPTSLRHPLLLDCLHLEPTGAGWRAHLHSTCRFEHLGGKYNPSSLCGECGKSAEHVGGSNPPSHTTLRYCFRVLLQHKVEECLSVLFGATAFYQKSLKPSTTQVEFKETEFKSCCLYVAGKHVLAAEALKLGILDELVEQNTVEAAIRFAERVSGKNLKYQVIVLASRGASCAQPNITQKDEKYQRQQPMAIMI